jgi:hypothetical protein
MMLDPGYFPPGGWDVLQVTASAGRILAIPPSVRLRIFQHRLDTATHSARCFSFRDSNRPENPRYEAGVNLGNGNISQSWKDVGLECGSPLASMLGVSPTSAMRLHVRFCGRVKCHRRRPVGPKLRLAGASNLRRILYRRGAIGLPLQHARGRPQVRTGAAVQAPFRGPCRGACADRPRIRLHDLRHAFAIAKLWEGWDVYDLMHHLGHSSVRVTERYAGYAPVKRSATVRRPKVTEDAVPEE